MTLTNSAEQLTPTMNPNGNDGEPLPPLYRHRKRPEWGLSLVAWEHANKRAHQFEDGQLRVIGRGYYKLFEEVDVPRGRAQEIVTKLRSQAGISSARRAALAKARRSGAEVLTLTKQLDAFRAKYPQCFSGTAWLSGQRGVDEARTLKRHRQPALASAAEQWTRERLSATLETSAQAVIDSWRNTVAATDLVTKKQIQPLEQVPEPAVDRVARAFIELLHGEAPIDRRIDTLCAQLPDLNWELVTAPLMLCFPDEHIAVNASSFKKQAAWMAPRMTHQPRPSGSQYLRYLEMAQRVKARLEEADAPPADLVDVHDFIRVSLLPSTLKLIASADSTATDSTATDSTSDA